MSTRIRRSTSRRFRVTGFLFSALAAFMVLGVGLSVPGCQTVKGLGEDIKNVGEAGEDAID